MPLIFKVRLRWPSVARLCLCFAVLLACTPLMMPVFPDRPLSTFLTSPAFRSELTRASSTRDTTTSSSSHHATAKTTASGSPAGEFRQTFPEDSAPADPVNVAGHTQQRRFAGSPWERLPGFSREFTERSAAVERLSDWEAGLYTGPLGGGPPEGTTAGSLGAKRSAIENNADSGRSRDKESASEDEEEEIEEAGRLAWQKPGGWRTTMSRECRDTPVKERTRQRCGEGHAVVIAQVGILNRYLSLWSCK